MREKNNIVFYLVESGSGFSRGLKPGHLRPDLQPCLKWHCLFFRGCIFINFWLSSNYYLLLTIALGVFIESWNNCQTGFCLDGQISREKAKKVFVRPLIKHRFIWLIIHIFCISAIHLCTRASWFNMFKPNLFFAATQH